MRMDDLESRMRQLEYFHGLRALPHTWLIVRVDGRRFSRMTERRFSKPFDPVMYEHMLGVARALMTELHGLYAYTVSDEVSVVLAPSWKLFDRELEKLVSLSASVATASFCLALGEAVQFDSRLWMGARLEDVVDYLRWRQADAHRSALNNWCYWTLRQEGQSVKEATRSLVKQTVADKNELLFSRGINFNNVPTWQRRGSALYCSDVEVSGFNPKTQQATSSRRRRLVIDAELPLKDEYSRMLERLLMASAGGA